MPTNDEIRSAIAGYVSGELGIDREEIESAANLRELPGVESVKVLRVVARIERDFEIEFDDELVFRVETIDELTEAVSSLVDARAT